MHGAETNPVIVNKFVNRYFLVFIISFALPNFIDLGYNHKYIFYVQ